MIICVPPKIQQRSVAYDLVGAWAHHNHHHHVVCGHPILILMSIARSLDSVDTVDIYIHIHTSIVSIYIRQYNKIRRQTHTHTWPQRNMDKC